MKGVSDLVPNDSPGDSLMLAVGSVLDCLLGHVIKRHYVVEHAHCLVERTVAIISGVRVLLQEVILYQLGYFKSDLVRLSQ